MDISFSLIVCTLLGILVYLILFILIVYIIEKKHEKKEYRNRYEEIKYIFDKYEINEDFREEIINKYSNSYLSSRILNSYQNESQIILDENNKELMIWTLYIDLLFEKIIYNFYEEDYLSKLYEKAKSYDKDAQNNYENENNNNIRAKMYKLSLNKKYNKIILDIMLSVYESSKKTNEFLKNIEYLDIPEKHKIKETNYVNAQVKDALSLFFEIIDILYEKHEDSKDFDYFFTGDYNFSELEHYNELLKSIKEDIINKKIIFS